ncbi:amino acid/polyamine transporter I [Ochromonadaceae sp. CCMP2298]|nr:amino acid/polyamine transporter I [Ochromonadaceae sp. CCMP2298]|mmetsp:Transcript_6362/g.14063  ORF Transcript_6362/g.14063 Transcript_6362/m.14063 type:complete len:503 (+) Transcript_6362:186-1694(+)|eukprot:CAMPEP_0173198216 /NCGR_PEP_ID=MMETSP1141-20130122/16572_1 /TAXON_ID=483371 /ORGANISM="non described non described, Strain CCMP2298" /LENGTH=502 /DNA_ID=CAMNT_0014123001 /DNA_START=100 /DNA_END=1608 /DNA_ORIENTATION=-
MMVENENFDRGSHRLIGNNDMSDLEDPRFIKPERKLTAVDGVAIVVGIIIGSGIFSSPGLALERCGSSGVVLIAWTLSGLVTMLAAMCYLELGSIMPSAGGDFDYLKRAYGDRMAFAFAWYNFFVGKTGSQAIIATIFGRYFEAVIKGNTSSLEEGSSSTESPLSKILAISLVVSITLLNCSGIKESAVLSIVLTTTKVLLILMVFMFAIVYICSGNSSVAGGNLSPATSFEGSKSPLGFGSAMVACLWSFDGFADGNFLMEELVNPIRDLPRIIVVGLSIVTSCYLLINIGYLSVLDKQDIIDSKAIAVQFGDAVSDALFDRGKQVLALVLAFGVSMSTAGSENGSIMTGGRAFFAVAREGKAPAAMARLNLAGAPWVALLAQGAWAIVLLCLPGSNFASLLDYFGPTSWMFYAFSASALIKLRHAEPHIMRPFKVPFYPLPPLMVMLVASVILVSSLYTNPLYVSLALGFVSLSIPVHLLMEHFDTKVSHASPVSSEDFE